MNAPRTKSLRFALGMALASAASVHAQQLPNIGDAVRQTQPPVAPATPSAPLPALTGVPAQTPAQAPSGGATVRIDRFVIVGNTAIDTATLLALVQPEQGKSLNLEQLNALAARITQHYRASGYFVARAYIPAQELKDGELTLRVVEGEYGRFVLDNRSRVRDDIVQGMLEQTRQDGKVVSLDAVERTMRLINDTPGMQLAAADVLPGQEVGSTDLAIRTEATAAFGGYVLLDNHGSVYTGKQRLSVGADWNSPTGRGDRLSASGLATRHSGLLHGRLAYSALLASDGTRGEVAISRTSYELAGVYAPLDATGTANSAELRVSKPLRGTRHDTIVADLGLSHKSLRDEVGATDTAVGKRLVSLQGGVARYLEHGLWGFGGLSTASANLTAGHLHFKDASAAALDAAGANTQGGYAKLNVALSRSSALPARFTLTTGLRAQAALGHKNLDGVERMSVSGIGAVAAYPIGELSGDHAALLHVELARPLMQATTTQVGASVFAHVGWADMASAPAGVDASRTLGGVGASLYAKVGGAVAKLQLVRRTTGGAPTSEAASRTRLLLQLGWVL